MKQILFFAFLCYASSCLAQAQGRFSAGLMYQQPNRAQYTQYLQVASDSFGLTKALSADQAYGITVSFHQKHERSELELGVSYSIARTKVSSDQANLTAKVTAKDLGLIFGLNYFPHKMLLVGGQLMVNSNSGDLEVVRTDNLPTTSLEDTPTGFNFLRGYCAIVRAQAGLNIQSASGRGVRLLPYYDFGLTPYNFYISHDHRLSGYTGKHKTRTAGPGVRLVFVL